MPGSNHVHYNAVLTRLSVEFRPPQFVAEQLLGTIKVDHESDVFPVFDKSLFNTVNDVRADGAPENETDQGWTFEPYLIEGHGLRQLVTDRQRRNADTPELLEDRAVEVIKTNILMGLEQRVFGTGGLVRTAANNVSSQNVSWATLSTASPRSDVEVGIRAVEDAAGVTPNTIVMTTAVARHIMRTAEYREETKYTVNLSQQGGAEDLPATWYGMKALYVGALVNTAKKGQGTTLSRLMGDDVWMGYIDPNIGQRSLTWATLLFTEQYARRWRDDEREGDFVAYNYNYVPKVIARECGYLLTTVLT